jgi:beta-N-acetylhexosaminidase
MRSRRAVLSAVIVALAASSAALGRADTGPTATVEQMAGQLVLARMQGQVPSASFLQRIRDGQIGGVVLFNTNFGSAGPAGLASTLQAAARAGNQPPLLIAVDQEGGIVKRLPGAPTLAPPQMRPASTAESQGYATARNLVAAGVNTDLAPVLDVSHGGFITPRTFGSTPSVVAARGSAFAAGLARGHVLATAKHFPGLGYATLNTDQSVAKVTASTRQLKVDWAPFIAAIQGGIPLVMMSTAVYPALGSNLPAALSPKVVNDLRRLGFAGAIVTDALQTPGVNGYASTSRAAVLAVNAGDDLVLAAGGTDTYRDTDGASVGAYNALVAAAKAGTLKQQTLRSAYATVLALKKGL